MNHNYYRNKKLKRRNAINTRISSHIGYEYIRRDEHVQK